MAIWDYPRLAWFLLGAWSVMGIVLFYEIVLPHLYWRRQRPMLERMAKMCGLRLMPGESMKSLRERIRQEMRMD